MDMTPNDETIPAVEPAPKKPRKPRKPKAPAEGPMSHDEGVAATIASLEADLGITKVRKPRKTKAQRQEEAAGEAMAQPAAEGDITAKVVLAENPELAIEVPLNFSPTLDMVAGVPTKVEKPDFKTMSWKERQKYEPAPKPYLFISKHAYTDKETGQQMLSKKGATAKLKRPDLFDVSETLTKRQARKMRKEAAKVVRKMEIEAGTLQFREGT